jgi:hypothetical protein
MLWREVGINLGYVLFTIAMPGEKNMSKLLVGSMVLAAAASAGCIIDNSAPNIGVTWQLRTNDQLTGCPAGYDTARVVAYPTGTTDTSRMKADLFDCANGSGITAPLPVGAWDVHVDISDFSGRNVYAQSLPLYVDLTQGDADIVVDIHSDKGYLYGNWALTGQASGGALTCANAGIPTVEFNATAAGALFPSQFQCEQSAGYSLPMPVGLFDVAVQAIASDNGAVGNSHGFPSQQVKPLNGVTIMGSAVLVIPGR